MRVEHWSYVFSLLRCKEQGAKAPRFCNLNHLQVLTHLSRIWIHLAHRFCNLNHLQVLTHLSRIWIHFTNVRAPVTAKTPLNPLSNYAFAECWLVNALEMNLRTRKDGFVLSNPTSRMNAVQSYFVCYNHVQAETTQVQLFFPRCRILRISFFLYLSILRRIARIVCVFSYWMPRTRRESPSFSQSQSFPSSNSIE